MPKSRQRKNHKKKSQARTLSVKNQKKKVEKELMEMFKKAQEETLMKQENEQENENELTDIDLGGNFEIEDEVKEPVVESVGDFEIKDEQED